MPECPYCDGRGKPGNERGLICPHCNPPKSHPEHEKLAAIKDKSQAIGGFLEWLEEQGITLCTLPENSDYFVPCHMPIQQRLAKYFDIDLNKLEQEKQAMLEELRQAHATES